MRQFLKIILLCLCASPVFGDEGLRGQWTWDGSLKNSASPETDASCKTEIPYAPGILGQCAELKNHSILVPGTIVPEDLKALTFCAWVSPSGFERYNEILRKEDGDKRLLFSFQENGTVLSLGLNVAGSYVECDATLVPEEVLDGSWHFAAATFDGQALVVYLDGVEIGRQARAGALHCKSGAGSAAMSIGSDCGNSEFFQGRMDEVRFYTRALSAQELGTLYREGLKNSPENPFVQQATEVYVKGESFAEALTQTRANLLALSEPADVRLRALVVRFLRIDYPQEVRALTAQNATTLSDLLVQPVALILEGARPLAERYVEYLPLTEEQWKVLSPQKLAECERVRDTRAKFDAMRANPGEAAFGEVLMTILEMRTNTHERPFVREAVAPYRPASTPPVVDLNAEQAEAALRQDWMFQCNNQPTVARTLQEIAWTRALADRLEKQNAGKLVFDGERKTLAELENHARSRKPEEVDAELYFAVRHVKRAVQFANPQLDFDSVLFVDGPYPEGSEWRHETRHRQGYMAVPGGRLMILRGLSPSGKQTKLMPQEPLHGAFWRPDLSFDGKKVLFCFQPHNEKAFHLYEMNVDGTGLRQLTGGMFDDLDPIYLPDGKNIAFLTTRGHLYVRCMPPTSAFVMARMELGSRDVYITSRNGEPEYTPSVMSDGRVIFTRWEYTDKPLWRCQSLWTMNPDGTQVQTFWGNQSVWPDLLKDARSIPGSERVMFTGSAHHQWFAGSVGIIDPRKGFNFPEGLTKVTADVQWPESGNGPVDPIESPNYHAAGAYSAYYSPYPLSETDFLVSACRNGKFVLLLMDVDGNRELIWEGNYNVFHAQPLRARPLPPLFPDRVDWPTRETRTTPGTGVIYSNNVYENASEELRGKAKFLRILSIDHKTYTYWDHRPYASTGPELSLVQSEGIKKVLGTVPIEDDGSVSFTAPTGVALHFQLLDENHRALQTMRSFTGVLPGENRGCLGCHESHVRTPVQNMSGLALRREPSAITPYPWKDISVSYYRYVQPVLDKYCGKCHEDPENDACKKFDMTLRENGVRTEPYARLLGYPSWGSAYRKPEIEPPGYGWADTILVEAYDTRDPVAYQTVAPMTRLSYKSRLVERMASGTHHDVKVAPEDLLRVILWVDTMGPLRGIEEMRALEDPEFQGMEWISIRPRVKTAPIVQRPGPFDAFDTDSDPSYAPPQECDLNRLPFGTTQE